MSVLAYRDPFPVARMARVDPPSHPVPTAPVIGQSMEDGTVYAGISPDTGRAMYATPKDTGLCATWHKAMDHAATLDAHGHKDWRVPTADELNQLFRHCADIGGFLTYGWYWSSSQLDKDHAWAQRFSDWSRFNSHKNLTSALRCVRG